MKPIEVEGGELLLKNSHGDLVVVPKNKAAWVKNKMADGCHDCIDEMVSSLPLMSQYAEDGTLVPNEENGSDTPSKPIKKARIYVRENDPVFNKEALRSLPLLEQRYGKGNVQIIPISQGNQKVLQQKLAEDLDADTFVYDHAGNNILGIPVAAERDIDLTSDEAYAKIMEYAKSLGTEPYLLNREQRDLFNEKYYAEEEAKPLNHTGTWAGSFPENYKGCAYWGACSFDDKAQYFTQESGVPSYSTGYDKWKGVNSIVKPLKTDQDFLNQFYFGADYKLHTKPKTEQ
jgi:hypothetical protein